MRYFIFYVTYADDFTTENYIKGKSLDDMLERIRRYSNGCIVTSQMSICTYNAQSIYVREIDLKYFPYLSKKDFATINEMKSYDHSDF